MKVEDNPLDLNNLPEDCGSKDGLLAGEGSSSSVADGATGGGEEEEEIGSKEGKGERCKVYECRFCYLKFSKSQALGGHMNRHRQERETENLNRARQLLFGEDALPHRLGACHPGSHVSDPILAFRSPSSCMYPLPLPPRPERLFSGSSSVSSSTILQPYIFQSPPRQLVPYPSNNISSGGLGLINRSNQYSGIHGTTSHGCGMGRAGGSSDASINYTCIGAPVREVMGGGVNHEEGLSWGERIDPHHQKPSSVINRFRDGF